MSRGLDKAIQYALQNPITSLPRMAAVLEIPNIPVLWIGYNKLTTHPLQKEFGRNASAIYLHAEIDAIVRALEEVSVPFHDAHMYVARVWKNGTPALAKPCVGCERAIVHFGITHVEWTT